MTTSAPSPLPEPTRYTVIKTGHKYSTALKMEGEKYAPGLLQLDASSVIRSDTPAAKLRVFTEIAVGDTLLVNLVRKLPNGPAAPFATASPQWTFTCPKPEAVVSMAFLCELSPRRKNLAFVAASTESSTAGYDPYVRVYDPMTLISTCLPLKHGLRVFPGDPVLVNYAVLPTGTFQPPTGDYHVPENAPYLKGK